MMRMRTILFGVAVVAAPAFFSARYVAAQDAPPAGAPQGGPPAGGAARRGPPGGDAGNEMVAELKATKGCLGVETAFTSSRKSVIFAWFEDKAATLRWYESDYHQTMMMGMQEANAPASGDAASDAASDATSDTPPSVERTPLEHVPDDVPVLCIATITPSMKPAIPGFPMPISQVSIELYTPLPGGLALNGKFAPAALKVRDMVEATLPAAGGGAGSSGG